MSAKVQTRNQAVLDAAVACAQLYGYRTMTRSQVAERAGVSVGGVNNAFDTMDRLRDVVMAHAAAHGPVDVLAQGLADKHPAAVAAPQELKDAALATLAA